MNKAETDICRSGETADHSWYLQFPLLGERSARAVCRWISLSQTLKDRRFSNAAKHVSVSLCERVQRARVNVRACACLRLLDGSGACSF